MDRSVSLTDVFLSPPLALPVQNRRLLLRRYRTRHSHHGIDEGPSPVPQGVDRCHDWSHVLVCWGRSSRVCCLRKGYSGELMVVDLRKDATGKARESVVDLNMAGGDRSNWVCSATYFTHASCSCTPPSTSSSFASKGADSHIGSHAPADCRLRQPPPRRSFRQRCPVPLQHRHPPLHSSSTLPRRPYHGERHLLAIGQAL